MYQDRDFNPITFVPYDNNEEEEFPGNVRVLQRDEVVWSSLHQHTNRTKNTILDGVYVVSDRPDIAKINGSCGIFRFPTVFDKHLANFKGLTEFFGLGTKHIYEFKLMQAGTFVLDALIATSDTVPRASLPSYFKMVKSYQSAVRNCVMSLPVTSRTRKSATLRLDGALTIYEEDWATIGDLLVGCLLNIARDPVHAENFPTSPQFFWSVKQLGQCKPRIRDLDTFQDANNSMLDAHVALTGNYKVSVHCAIDYAVQDQILWWKLPHVIRSWGQIPPKNVYHVGLLPGLGNVIFENPRLPRNFHFVQYYTRMFQEAHRDTNKLFINPYLARNLVQRYLHVMTGSHAPKLNAKDKTINAGGIRRFLESLASVSETSAEARVELVYSSSSRFLLLSESVQEAFDSMELLTETDPRFQIPLLHSMNPAWFSARLQNWLPYFVNSTQLIFDKVSELSQLNNQYLVPLSLCLDANAFCIVSAVESIICMFVKGKVGNDRLFNQKFWEQYLGINQLFFDDAANPRNLIDNPWPFQNLIRNEENQTLTLRVRSSQLGGLRNILSTDKEAYERISNLMFHTLARLRCAYDEAGNDPRLRERVAADIASEVLKIIILHQIRIKTPSWSSTQAVDLKMLLRDPFVPERKIRYMTPANFWRFLTLTRPRGHFPEHTQLFGLLDVILNKIVIRNPTFQELLENKIQQAIQTQCTPLRFSYGPFQELLVLVNRAGFSTDEAYLTMWRSSLRYPNIGRLNLSKISLTRMIHVVCAWDRYYGSDNICMVEVMKGVQEYFDTGYISCQYEVPYSLRLNLINNIISVSPRSSIADQNSSSPDLADVNQINGTTENCRVQLLENELSQVLDQQSNSQISIPDTMSGIQNTPPNSENASLPRCHLKRKSDEEFVERNQRIQQWVNGLQDPHESRSRQIQTSLHGQTDPTISAQIDGQLRHPSQQQRDCRLSLVNSSLDELEPETAFTIPAYRAKHTDTSHTSSSFSLPVSQAVQLREWNVLIERRSEERGRGAKSDASISFCDNVNFDADQQNMEDLHEVDLGSLLREIEIENSSTTPDNSSSSELSLPLSDALGLGLIHSSMFASTSRECLRHSNTTFTIPAYRAKHTATSHSSSSFSLPVSQVSQSRECNVLIERRSEERGRGASSDTSISFCDNVNFDADQQDMEDLHEVDLGSLLREIEIKNSSTTPDNSSSSELSLPLTDALGLGLIHSSMFASTSRECLRLTNSSSRLKDQHSSEDYPVTVTQPKTDTQETVNINSVGVTSIDSGLQHGNTAPPSLSSSEFSLPVAEVKSLGLISFLQALPISEGERNDTEVEANFENELLSETAVKIDHHQ